MAKLLVTQDQLRKVYAAKKDDEKALKRALKKAKDVGLTSVYSTVVRDVEAHLRKVVLTA